jgi:hypothetical protein
MDREIRGVQCRVAAQKNCPPMKLAGLLQICVSFPTRAVSASDQLGRGQDDKADVTAASPGNDLGWKTQT